MTTDGSREGGRGGGRRMIPLEPVSDSQEPDDDRVAFTDVVLTLYVTGMPAETDADGEETLYDADALRESLAAAFSLGCAVGLEFPSRVNDILEQTHPGNVEQIIDECREPLQEEAKQLRSSQAADPSAAPVGPEVFIDPLLTALEGREHVDAETAYGVLSMGFEYGCVLAATERAAAMVVRNAYDRRQAEASEDAEGNHSEPGPFQALREFAREVMDAYEQDIGF